MSNLQLKLDDLYNDSLEVTEKYDQLNQLLNSPPKKEWIQINKYANNSNYIPIGTIENLLKKIFQRFHVEILREGQMFNAVYCTIRLHYWHPIDKDYRYTDGIGGMEIQTKKDCSPADLSSINKGAVMMALPAAKSYAIKDAAELLGVIFGKDLNRKDIAYFGNTISDDELKDIRENLDLCTDEDVLNKFFKGLPEDLKKNPDIIELFKSKKQELCK